MILELTKVKAVTVSIVSPSICREVMGLDCIGSQKSPAWQSTDLAYVHQIPISLPFCPQPLATTLPFCEFECFSNLITWTHTVLIILRLACLTWHSVFKVLPHCSLCQHFLPHQGLIIFHRVQRAHRVYPSPVDRPGCFPLLAAVRRLL